MKAAHRALLAKYRPCSFPPVENLVEAWAAGQLSVPDMLWGAARLFPHAGWRFAALASMWAQDADADADAAAYYAVYDDAADADDAAYYAAAAAAYYAVYDDAAYYAAASEARKQQQADIRAMFPEMPEAIEFFAANSEK